jgi:hypothetical protein
VEAAIGAEEWLGTIEVMVGREEGKSDDIIIVLFTVDDGEGRMLFPGVIVGAPVGTKETETGWRDD